MSEKEVGLVDYDYDRYKNKVRKYVVTSYVEVGEKMVPVWHQVSGFCPENDINNFKRDLSERKK